MIIRVVLHTKIDKRYPSPEKCALIALHSPIVPACPRNIITTHQGDHLILHAVHKRDQMRMMMRSRGNQTILVISTDHVHVDIQEDFIQSHGWISHKGTSSPQ